MMLKPRVLSNVFSQVNTGGVVSTFLFKMDGTLIGYANAETESDCQSEVEEESECEVEVENYDPRIGAAVAATVWNSFEKSGRGSLNEDPLRLILIECEEGRLAIQQVSPRLFLCLMAKENVELGVLKAKIDALAKYIEGPLEHVEHAL